MEREGPPLPEYGIGGQKLTGGKGDGGRGAARMTVFTSQVPAVLSVHWETHSFSHTHTLKTVLRGNVAYFEPGMLSVATGIISEMEVICIFQY